MKADKTHLEKLLPETREILKKSDGERISHIKEDRFVTYPMAREIQMRLEELLEEPKKTRMPGLLIVGDSNNGKTSVVSQFERRHPPTEGTEAAAVTVLSTQAPFVPDVNSFLNQMLDDLKVPFKQSNPVSKKEIELRYHFDELGIKMLIIDEIHNILSGSVLRQRAFMNAIKNLSNGIKIPIVLVGIKDALNATNTDEQISSRFRPVFLPRWEFGRDYLSLLMSIEKTLPLKQASNMAKNEEIAESILDLSEGLIGEIVFIINEASIRAIKSGKEKMTIEDVKDIGFVKPSARRTSNIVGGLWGSSHTN